MYSTSENLELDIYTITVYTSDRLYAGTDNDVFMELIGEFRGQKIRTGEFLLDESGRDDFERNQTDVFRVPASSLGNGTDECLEFALRHSVV